MSVIIQDNNSAPVKLFHVWRLRDVNYGLTCSALVYKNSTVIETDNRLSFLSCLSENRLRFRLKTVSDDFLGPPFRYEIED